MSKYYLIAFILAGGVSFILTPLVRQLSLKMGWLDEPNWRKINKKPIPRMGGIAICLGFAISLAVLASKEPFAHDRYRLLGLLGSALVIFLVGVEDDIRGLSARRKLFYQIIAALVACLFGYLIEKISFPFGGPLNLPFIVSLGITVFWIVGFTNAINLLDGLDGLASGVVAIIAASLCFASIKNSNPFAAILSLAIAGSALGFLRYNFYPAKIFMGDSGSMFLGFVLALISIEGAHKGATLIAMSIPVIAMGVPVVDTGLSILRRLVNGNGVFKPDKEHVHHKLLYREGSQKKAVITLYFLTASFGAIAMALSGMSGIWALFALIITALLTLRWAINSGLFDFIEEEFPSETKRNLQKRR